MFWYTYALWNDHHNEGIANNSFIKLSLFKLWCGLSSLIGPKLINCGSREESYAWAHLNGLPLTKLDVGTSIAKCLSFSSWNYCWDPVLAPWGFQPATWWQSDCHQTPRSTPKALPSEKYKGATAAVTAITTQQEWNDGEFHLLVDEVTPLCEQSKLNTLQCWPSMREILSGW